jgi:hypothetical protein
MLLRPLSTGSGDADGGGNSGARSSMNDPHSRSTDKAGSIHTDNNRIRTDSCNIRTGRPDNQIRLLLRPARRNAARVQKPIHLPSKQLRAVFSLQFTPFLVCCFARDQSSLRRIPRRLMDMRPPL